MANKKREKRNRYYSRQAQISNSGTITPEPRNYAGAARFVNRQGVRGLKHASGYIQEEWRTEFKSWNRAVKQFLEMRDYYVIATMLDAIKLPLLAAPFTTEPAEARTPGDIAASDWLYEVMHRMHKQTWNSHAEDMLSAIEFGWALGEIVLEKRADGRLWLRNIDPRGQDTLERWKFDDEHRDEVVEMIQRDPNSHDTIPIPMRKCVHVTFRGRKGNPEGHSILISCHWPYRQCKDAEIFEMMGIERDVGGMPVAELPAEGNVTPDDIDTLEEGLKGMRRDENEYVILPPGAKLNPYGSSSKMYDIGSVIERKKKEILMRLFAQFLMLGMDQVGTQALVQGAQSFFNLALEAVQRQVEEAWNQQLVPYLFAFNSFPGMTDYPKIVWTQPGQIDLAQILNVLNTAVGAKIFTPTDVDEDHLREVMDWPDLPEDERGQPRDVEAPAMPGLFDLPKKVQHGK